MKCWYPVAFLRVLKGFSEYRTTESSRDFFFEVLGENLSSFISSRKHYMNITLTTVLHYMFYALATVPLARLI